MITGDSLETATAIGKQLGILKEPIKPTDLMSGNDFQSLLDGEQVQLFFFFSFLSFSLKLKLFLFFFQ